MTKHTIEQTYQTIYRSCFPKLVTYLQRKYACNRQDAEDIASQALHILWQKWDGLDSHTEAGILCWLFLTVQNLMRNEAKKKAAKPCADQSGGDDRQSASHCSARNLTAAE